MTVRSTPGAESEVPTPPWRRAGRKAPTTRQPLSQDAILDAAMRVLAAEGLDAVSMRRVAQELNTGPASLYAHVADKDELLELMLDRAMAGIQVPAADPARWQDQLKDLLRAGRDAMVAHRDIARVAQAVIPTRPNGLRMAEGMLAILRAGGLPDQVSAWAIDCLALYVTADAVESALHAGRHTSQGGFVDELRAFYASLPPDRFPNLIAMVGPLTAGEGDQRFEFGLDIFVRGLAAHAGGSGIDAAPAG